MSLNGKRDNLTIEDFNACAKSASMKRGRGEEIVRQVQKAVLQWRRFAEEAEVLPVVADGIAVAHRTDILA